MYLEHMEVYWVTKVRMNGNQIEKLRAMEIQPYTWKVQKSTAPEARTYTKQEAIASMRAGREWYDWHTCALYDGWYWPGPETIIVNVDGVDYLKFKKGRKEEDNLGDILKF